MLECGPVILWYRREHISTWAIKNPRFSTQVLLRTGQVKSPMVMPNSTVDTTLEVRNVKKSARNVLHPKMSVLYMCLQVLSLCRTCCCICVSVCTCACTCCLFVTPAAVFVSLCVHVAARVISSSYLLLYLCLCVYMWLHVLSLCHICCCINFVSLCCWPVHAAALLCCWHAHLCVLSTPLFVLTRAPISDIIFPFAMSVDSRSLSALVVSYEFSSCQFSRRLLRCSNEKLSL